MKRILLFFAIVGVWGCGTTTATRGSTGGTNNELSNAFPSDLAVSSPTASESSASPLSMLKFQATMVTPENFLDKREDLGNLIDFADETTFTTELAEMKDEINIFASAPSATCYGPNLNYVNHSDALAGEVDPDTTDGTNDDDGQLPPGDLGIWTETEATSGEACCAAKMNNIIGQFEALLNAGTKTVAAALGAASLDANLADLPDAGSTLDMASQANEVMDDNNIPIDFSAATLAREASDTADGDPVFVTSITESFDAGDKTAEMEATLEHIPMGEATTAAGLTAEADISNETYCGRLTQAVNIPAVDLPTLGNCGALPGPPALPAADGITRCTLVEYCKDAATSITFHLRTAEFCGQNAPCGTVDPSDKRSASNLDGWGNGFYYTVCTINPEDGTGRCAQAWQAGWNDGNTRVLNVVVNDDDTGRCYFGFGPDVASTTGTVGAIDRMICNWAGPGSSHTGLELAQRQEFSRNTSGIFVPTGTSRITYAPTNSCNKTAGTFAYGLQSPPTDVSGGTAVTHNLINLTDVDFTVPTLPVVP